MPGNNVKVGTQVTGVGKASSDLDKLRDKFDKFSKTSAKGFAIGAGAGLALGAVNALSSGIGVATDFIQDSIKASSDLNESMSKSQVVFGRASSEVSRWGDTTAKSMGLSKQAAIEAASSLGNLFTGLGESQAKAAGMSERMVQLAGDLASFNNIDPTVALEKLRSGLSGESEPLRSVGVFLTEAKVKAKAMEMGLADAHGELTEGAKVMARYELIMQETTTAQGDFARTADGLANSQRTATAELKDYEAALGAKLLPAQLAATRGQIQFIQGLGQLEGGLSDAGANLDGFIAQFPILGGAESIFAKQSREHWALIASNTERATDDSTTSMEGMRGAMGLVEDKSDHLKDSIKTDTGHIAKSFFDLAASMATDAQSTIDDYFDPLEERADLFDTHQRLLAAQEAARTAKTKTEKRQAADDVIEALDDEGTALVDLGKKHKLTAKDVDKYERDVKASYKAIGRAVPPELQKIINKLRELANVKGVGINVSVNGRLSGAHGGGFREFGASGGRFAAGADLTVGEEGWERMRLLPGGGAVVTDHAKSMASLPSAGGGSARSAGGGGLTIENLNVYAGAGSGLTAGSARQLANELGPAIYADMQRRGLLPRTGTGLRG